MYCLRAFTVLLFLPFPTAPPLFCYLFLLAFYLQRRPCIYCTLLLIGVFATTCYWDLAPANSLAASTGESLHRCWCDLNGGHLLSMRTVGINFTTSVTEAAASRAASCASNATALAQPTGSQLAETLACNATSQQPMVQGIGSSAKTAVVGWLNMGIEAISGKFTEEYLGFKLVL